jgi:DNA repair protein RadC
MEYTPLLTLKKEPTEFPKVKIKSSFDSSEFIRKFYSDDIGIFESFFILLLNNNMETIAYAKISQGGVVATFVDSKIIAKYCLDSLAQFIILAHNHPSGNLTPSSQDIKITEKIKEVLNIIDVQVIDHIILSEEGYYSFSDNGKL